ncbi:unnamed protein product [Candida verbasci]|uniref:Meiotically up-regulated protein Msb1/Mug8 domain-containing protein n=1 Tax=Candida verbasci TaxID=1227364 RepID=A0A9W4TWP0_9ASCO|nr:unnamed protein product [Candida verbasci]
MTTELKLPKLPTASLKRLTSTTYLTNAGLLTQDQFTRKKLKSILHVITRILKAKGTKTPHIFLPFRSKIKDENLEHFLGLLSPNGKLITNEALIEEICSTIDDFTLVSALKFFWSRLPNNEIIGYDVYLEFKRKEQELGYPKNGFLTIMPKCLSSSSHASIVYDFLDLLINIISNSQFNYLSGRKVSKMASFYAFNNIKKDVGFLNATIENEFNFIKGINVWKNQTNALFHLVLSFLRSMLPESDGETIKIPKTLQSLLITTSYPPNDENENTIKNFITIPCVCIKTTRPSMNAYELISKIRHSLSFTNKNDFLSIENYTILKNLFSQKATSDIINSLTEESRRIVNRITAEPIDNSKFDLNPGWCDCQFEIDHDIPLYSQIEINNVSIQDYYIWTWLTSLASDQPNTKKSLFGRSIVVEADISGFQKWIVLTEKTMTSDEYLKHFKLDKEKELPKPYSKKSPIKENINKDLPPPPVEDGKLENDVSVEKEEVSFKEDEEDSSFIVYPTQDYQEFEDYLNSTSLKEIENLTSKFSKTSVHEDILPKTKHNVRKAPPPIESTEIKSAPIQSRDLKPKPIEKDSEIVQHNEYYEPFDVYQPELDKKQNNANEERYDNYHIPTIVQPKISMEKNSFNNKEIQPHNNNANFASVSRESNDSTAQPATLREQGVQPRNEDQNKQEPLDVEEKELKEERRSKRKEKKKLEKQAQAAQLAAAQAAGFPFPFLPNGIPPPPPPDPNLISSDSSKSNFTSVSPFLIPENNKTVTASTKSPVKKRKSPKKVKPIDVDENKPLPDIHPEEPIKFEPKIQEEATLVESYNKNQQEQHDMSKVFSSPENSQPPSEVSQVSAKSLPNNTQQPSPQFTQQSPRAKSQSPIHQQDYSQSFQNPKMNGFYHQQQQHQYLHPTHNQGLYQQQPMSQYQQPMMMQQPMMTQQPMQQPPTHHHPYQQYPQMQMQMLAPQLPMQQQQYAPQIVSPQMQPFMTSQVQLPQQQPLQMYGMPPMKKPGMTNSASNNAMMNMVPMGQRHNKNQTTNKANLRNAFISGNYGI